MQNRLIKLYAAHVWRQDRTFYDDGRWLDRGYIYAYNPWVRTDFVHPNGDGQMIVPAHEVEVHPDHIDRYDIVDSNEPEE
jgi:hypothetical protein